MGLPISGQTTVASAGTAVALGNRQVNGPLAIRPLPTNTGSVAIGNDGAGDVTVSNGLLLAKTDPAIIFDYVGNLEDIFLDAGTNGDGVSWVMLQVV